MAPQWLLALAALCAGCQPADERAALAEFTRMDSALGRVQEAHPSGASEALTVFRALKCHTLCDFQRQCASAYERFFDARRRVADVRATLGRQPSSSELDELAADLLRAEVALNQSMDSIHQCISRQGGLARGQR